MGKEIEVASGGALALRPDQTAWTPQQEAAVRQLGLEDATQEDLAVFLHVAQRSGLDPFARQIHMIGRSAKKWNPQTRTESWTTKYTIQTGIDGFRLIADRSGKYAGQVGPQWCGEDGQWKDVWLSPKPPAAARVGVLRTDFREPMWAVAVFTEYAQAAKNGELTSMWKSKGSIMIAKCAEALALRKAFPQDLSGLYTAEEMAQADMADQRLRVVESPARTVEAAPTLEATVVLPSDFDDMLVDAEADGSLDQLADLGAIAKAAHDDQAAARARAAWRRVKANPPAPAAEPEVVDAEPALDADAIAELWGADSREAGAR